MPGGERLIGIGLGVMLLTEFLKDEERSGTHECMGCEFGGDHWFEVAVARIEPTEQVEDLAGLGDRMTDRTQLIGEALQLSAVFIDGEIALVGAAKLSLKVDSTLEFVVVEEAFELGPQGEGSEVRFVDDIEDRFGDGEKDPIDDARIRQLPLSVALSLRGGRADVFGQPKLAEDGIEEAPPL